MNGTPGTKVNAPKDSKGPGILAGQSQGKGTRGESRLSAHAGVYAFRGPEGLESNNPSIRGNGGLDRMRRERLGAVLPSRRQIYPMRKTDCEKGAYLRTGRNQWRENNKGTAGVKIGDQII